MEKQLPLVVGKGGISAKILADSVSYYTGDRLTTFELEYPRFIHSEVMTHRMLSKNAASTRAIPVSRAIEQVQSNPAMPIHWGQNNPGMRSNNELTGVQLEAAKTSWRAALDAIISYVKVMSDPKGINGHKQWVGRWLETATMIKVVFTGTEFANLYWLRDHEDAQPEFHELARVMRQAQAESKPETLSGGDWHLPYITVDGGRYYAGGVELENLEVAKRVSVSCCAQVSYRRSDESVDKADKIIEMLNLGQPGKKAHASPTEHQGTPIITAPGVFDPARWDPGVTHIDREGSLWSGNLRGWVQHRQLIPYNAVH